MCDKKSEEIKIWNYGFSIIDGLKQSNILLSLLHIHAAILSLNAANNILKKKYFQAHLAVQTEAIDHIIIPVLLFMGDVETFSTHERTTNSGECTTNNGECLTTKYII